MRMRVVVVLVVAATVGCGSATVKGGGTGGGSGNGGNGGNGGSTAGTIGSGGAAGASGAGGGPGVGGSIGGTAGTGGGGIGGAAGTGGGAGCNLSADFSKPTLVPGINTNAEDDGFSLSPDQLTAWFSSSRPGGMGIQDIWIATRPTPTAAFNSFTVAGGVNSPGLDTQPRISNDGLTLMFTSDRNSGRAYDLVIATRTSTAANFSTPVEIAGVNTTSTDGELFLTADGQTMYFTSNRPGGPGANDLYVATKSASGMFNTPAVLTGIVNTTANEDRPVPSPDGLTLYFARNTDPATDNYEIWVAHRSSPTGAFNSVEIIPSLNSPLRDTPLLLSDDGCTLYLSSSRTGGVGATDIYAARRGN